MSLTHNGRQAALHPELLATQSDPSNARATVWDVPIECQQVDSPVAPRVESGPRGPTAPPSPYSRRIDRAAGDTTDSNSLAIPPCVQDGTERPIQRPKDPEDQPEYDRGKKKCHTLKNLFVIHETCHIFFWSHTCEGKVSDKSLAELAGYP